MRIISLVLILVLLLNPSDFYFFWVIHEKFSSIVAETWGKQVDGWPMFRIWQKLKNLKPPSKILNANFYGNVTETVRRTRVDLENTKSLLMSSPTEDLTVRK